MSYAGHVLDMINRAKANRELVMARKEKMSRLKEKIYASSHFDHQAYMEKKIDSEVMLRIKEEIRREIRRHRIVSRSLSVFVTLAIILSGIMVLLHFM
ncbi:MAG: hypothetical protein ACOYXB_16860 [Bacteroidota bacterium]